MGFGLKRFGKIGNEHITLKIRDLECNVIEVSEELLLSVVRRLRPGDATLTRSVPIGFDRLSRPVVARSHSEL